jgi:hypothetical protein
MGCQHIEEDITTGRFKVGDRVTRPVDIHAPFTKWVLKRGTVVRAYRQQGCQFGPYPELYDVQWDEQWRVRAPGMNQDNYHIGEHGFLPHGIDAEVTL